MKHIEEEKLLDLFLLAYRLGEIKDMNNLLNSEMRERAKETIEIYLKNEAKPYNAPAYNAPAVKLTNVKKEKQNEKNNITIDNF